MNFGSNFTPVSFFSPAVPPFPLNAANNGLSVDTASFKIVLGNNVNQVGAPAMLLSNREIQMGTSASPFTIQLINQTRDQSTILDASVITLQDQIFDNPQINLKTSFSGNDGAIANASGAIVFFDNTLTSRLTTLLSTGDTTITGKIQTGKGVMTQNQQPWNLGQLITTAGLTFDTDDYVEVAINGHIVRLAVANLPA